MEVLVEYDYQALNPDELTIKKGDRIRNVLRKEEGWYEGELVSNGLRGVFPDNFVKPIKPTLMSKTLGFNTNNISTTKSPDDKKKNFLNNTIGSVVGNGSAKLIQQSFQATSPPPPPPPSSATQHQQQMPVPQAVKQANDHFNARVIYSYVPANEDELTIQENDIVQVIRLVEDGWYEGLLNGRRGVFPSNYVEKLNDSPKIQATPISNGLLVQANLSTESLTGSSLIETNPDLLDDKRKNKKVLGIGFGNIFSGKQIELKTKENFNTPSSSSSPPIIKNPNPTQNQKLLIQQEQEIPSHTPTPTAVNKRLCKAKVIFDYDPTQADELKLTTGEIIFILDKHLEDEGWWRGESIATGKIGVFPDNFVEEIQEPVPVISATVMKRKPAQTQIPVKHAQNDSVNLNSMGSSSSVSSSNNSLPRETSQVIIKQAQTISSPLEDGRTKSQSDMSEDLEEIQSNKLTHIKKTRQFNKRPPSFRSKTRNGENEEQFVKPPNTLPISGSQSNELSSSSQNKFLPGSPKSPTRSVSGISNIGNGLNGNSLGQSLTEDMSNMRHELDLIKKSSSQMMNDYKMVQSELHDVKKHHDEQMRRMQKRLNDLVYEIDEEKKTRLALQVELERLKKTIMMNN